MPMIGWTGGTLLGAVATSIMPEILSSAMGIALYGMFIAIMGPLVELCVEPAGLCGRCTGVAVPVRVVPSPTGLPLKRSPGRGSFSRADRGIAVVRHVAAPTWLFSNFLVRPASSLGAPGRPGTPSRPRRGIASPVAIRRGEGAQRKRCRDPRCSPRGTQVCRGTFGGRRKAVRDRLALQGGTGDFP